MLPQDIFEFLGLAEVRLLYFNYQYRKLSTSRVCMLVHMRQMEWCAPPTHPIESAPVQGWHYTNGNAHCKISFAKLVLYTFL